MGTIKTTNIETITGSGTLTLGQSGETISVPSGATINLSNATQTGVGGTNTPYFQAYRNATLTFGSGTWTKITFDTEDFDTASGFDTSTGKYTIQSGQAGKYFIGFSVRSVAADGADKSIRIFAYGEKVDTGGTSVNFGNDHDFSNGYGKGGSLEGAAILNCAVGDAIQVNLYHQTVSGGVQANEGGNRPTYFYGYKLIE